MTFQYSSALRDNQVAQIQATLNAVTSGQNQNGGYATLKIFSGAEPANASLGDPSGMLVTMYLPQTFLTHAGGVTTLAGTWTAQAANAGTAQSFRMYDYGGTCHIQGDTTNDLKLNNNVIAAGQTVTVTSFSVTAGNS